ncbi:MAG: FAD-binding domain-containing protein [Hydrogenophaga sp.]|uniref:FAD-binding domain-containing protein n=1 Tax=Hydrogenophaga sp. TaxID=1904254 RepID=UPI0027672653|nr:FAD-binding domain-containing protein [Hydrogenophaga sp.]MDP2418035.1 FAD-binding domain-containing protein [Hydrogenophaga sp.]MDZ4189416.1 FAD-binding domain-containing protein [Hydrogenophaga sp.]
MTYSVVWFKRDLRVHDHAALRQAAARGPVLCLYVLEPSLWAEPDAATQHLHFLRESLLDLYAELKALGARLHVATGEVTDVLSRLRALAPFDALYTHEETGNAATYRRDLAVGRWCRAHGVAWVETPQFGVVRRLPSRQHWQSQWAAHTRVPVLPAPDVLLPVTLPWREPPMPCADQLGLQDPDPPQRQRGGRSQALAVLHEFLALRSAQYRGGISSPLRAPSACSRLSPYLALGCLSLREVVQATQWQMARLPPEATRQRQGLNAFMSRLVWHCHFIQKLEDEPELEWRNLHRGYDGLRDEAANPAYLEALMQGRTGWPMVDACVAMLRETGWLNFRMRAMLVSVAAYPLWLHWRPVGLWLARQFLDYEPGIHWSQLQMQSGTTGINTTRVYNPIKQAHDHDPQGHFVRRWLPAMRRVPDAWLFEPWRMPPDVQARCGVRVGVDIPMPLVELETATREAKARLHARRAQPEVRAAKAAIVEKHASRKRSAQARARSGPPNDPGQASLF